MLFSAETVSSSVLPLHSPVDFKVLRETVHFVAQLPPFSWPLVQLLLVNEVHVMLMVDLIQGPRFSAVLWLLTLASAVVLPSITSVFCLYWLVILIIIY